MKNETYAQVAFIVLRNPDGTSTPDVPLYVKVCELNKNGMTDTQEELIHKISAVMIRQYEKQIAEYFAQKKEQK